MRPITYEDFIAARERDAAYYIPSRWDYYARVIELAAELVPEPKSVLELGPHLLPIFPEADTMDIAASKGPTFVHDGGKVPWPISTNAYDLFIGLQVFEHLGKTHTGERVAGWRHQAQAEAFQEVKRIAEHAIISLPWKWDKKEDLRHYGIDEETIVTWFDLRPQSQEVLGKRIILTWSF